MYVMIISDEQFVELWNKMQPDNRHTVPGIPTRSLLLPPLNLLVLVDAIVAHPHKCFLCGIKQWRKKKIVFEVEHKDGDFQNDKEDNLEFICPNCHSQTNTFCRNRKVFESKTTADPKPKRKKTGRKPRNPSADGYWRTKDKLNLRKVERPGPAELQSLIQSMPMIKIGEKYGVSDNAVRKWLKRYGMTMPKFFGRSRGPKSPSTLIANAV